MKPEDKQHFEDLIVKAVQSGKRETSDLVDTILHRIEPVVAKAIETHVNGKIRNLDTKIDAYIVEDNKWKEKALPAINIGLNALTFGSVSVGLLKFVAILGVACGFVYTFFRWIK